MFSTVDEMGLWRHLQRTSKLRTDEMKAFVTTTPSGRDDDVIQLSYLIRENERGRLTYIVSQDLFTDHVRSGLISAELLDSRLLSFAFLADSRSRGDYCHSSRRRSSGVVMSQSL